MKDVVLKRWAKRCGADAACISNWNATAGKVANPGRAVILPNRAGWRTTSSGHLLAGSVSGER